MKTNESGIYVIYNSLTNKRYIGSTVNLRRRITMHRCLLNKGKHFNGHLQNSWNKNKGKNFKFNILEKIVDKNELIKREQLWINYYKSCISEFGYNICSVAGTTLGIKFSEEVKKKMRGRILSHEHKRKIVESRKWYSHSEQTRRKISIRNKGNKYFFGHKHTEETKKKISERVKGKNNGMYGKSHSLETKKKMSLLRKGEGNGMYGKTHSLSVRNRLSEYRLGMKMPLSFRKKMSKVTKGENNGMYGKIHSVVAKKAISEKLKLRGGHKGEKNPNNKIKNKDIKNIIRLKFIEKENIIKIANKYHVCGNTIYNILKKAKNYAKTN